ncbi:MAG: hypothetical protein ACI4LX_05740 [Treponema sp.]
MTHFIAHRVNTLSELKKIPSEYGVEVDLRDDLTGRIYIQHNPFEDGEDFEPYAAEYGKNHNGTMILNVKSERIEHKVLEIVKKNEIKNYFFLDSTFPMIKLLSDMGERNIAVRFSEYEGMDTVRAMAGKIDWIWVDTFSRLPLDKATYTEMRNLDYTLCLVSPELQGQGEKIGIYKKQIAETGIVFDAICTKSCNIENWR